MKAGTPRAKQCLSGVRVRPAHGALHPVILLYPTGFILLAAGIAGVLLLLRSLAGGGRGDPSIPGCVRTRERRVTRAPRRSLAGAAISDACFAVPRGRVGGRVPTDSRVRPWARRRRRDDARSSDDHMPAWAFDQHVIQRLRSHSVVHTAFDLVGLHERLHGALFVIAVALSMGAAARAAGVEVSWRPLTVGMLTGAAFAVVATQIPRLLDRGSPAVEFAGAVLVVATAVAVVLIASRMIFGPSSRAGTIERRACALNRSRSASSSRSTTARNASCAPPAPHADARATRRLVGDRARRRP